MTIAKITLAKLALTAAGLVSLGAGAPPVLAQDAKAPLVTKAGPIAAPAPGKGLIVFWRPGTLVGGALGCTVHEGPAQVARLGAGKFYAVTAEPGKHVYNTEGEAKDVLNLEVEPDETYFVKCKIGMGVMSGRANLSPSDRDEFAKKAKGLDVWKPKDKKAD